MSYYYCKNIKEDNGTISIEVACNNVVPRIYDWCNLKGDNQLKTLAELVYHNEVQLMSSAYRSGIGRKIKRAIDNVCNGDIRAWQKNTEDWQEQGKIELEKVLAQL